MGWSGIELWGRTSLQSSLSEVRGPLTLGRLASLRPGPHRLRMQALHEPLLPSIRTDYERLPGVRGLGHAVTLLL